MSEHLIRNEMVEYLVREYLGEPGRAALEAMPLTELRQLCRKILADLAEMERKDRLEAIWAEKSVAG